MAKFLKQIFSHGSTILGASSKIPTTNQLVFPESKLETYIIDMFLGHGRTLTNPCPECGCDCCRVLTGQDSSNEGHCVEWQEWREWLDELCAELDAAQAEEGFVNSDATKRLA